MLHGGKRRQQWLNQRIDRCVNKDDFVFSVINDVRELLWEQTNVQGVSNTTTTRCGKVQLKVTLCVPCECSNTAMLRDAQLIKYGGKTTRAVCPHSVCGALDASCSGSDDVLFGVILLSTIKQVIDGQLSWLH